MMSPASFQARPCTSISKRIIRRWRLPMVSLSWESPLSGGSDIAALLHVAAKNVLQRGRREEEFLAQPEFLAGRRESEG